VTHRPVLVARSSFVALCVMGLACSDGSPARSVEAQPEDSNVGDGDVGAPASATATGGRVRCTFFARVGEREPFVDDEQVVEVSVGTTKALTVGGLTLELGYTSGDTEGASVHFNVRDDETPVMSALYQLRDRRLPSNQFVGGHGFTGLIYLHGREGANHQVFCETLD